MKCPKCKKQMSEYEYGNVFQTIPVAYCYNEQCEWFGIKRELPNQGEKE